MRRLQVSVGIGLLTGAIAAAIVGIAQLALWFYGAYWLAIIITIGFVAGLAAFGGDVASEVREARRRDERPSRAEGSDDE